MSPKLFEYPAGALSGSRVRSGQRTAPAGWSYTDRGAGPSFLDLLPGSCKQVGVVLRGNGYVIRHLAAWFAKLRCRSLVRLDVGRERLALLVDLSTDDDFAV